MKLVYKAIVSFFFFLHFLNTLFVLILLVETHSYGYELHSEHSYVLYYVHGRMSYFRLYHRLLRLSAKFG
jgi:hypothetical protein